MQNTFCVPENLCFLIFEDAFITSDPFFLAQNLVKTSNGEFTAKEKKKKASMATQ